MNLGYMGSSFIQLIYAGAALGGVITGVSATSFWGVGWVRWDDVARERLGAVYCCWILLGEQRPLAAVLYPSYCEKQYIYAKGNVLRWTVCV
jgi:hypothetical protein